MQIINYSFVLMYPLQTLRWWDQWKEDNFRPGRGGGDEPGDTEKPVQSAKHWSTKPVVKIKVGQRTCPTRNPFCPMFQLRKSQIIFIFLANSGLNK